MAANTQLSITDTAISYVTEEGPGFNSYRSLSPWRRVLVSVTIISTNLLPFISFGAMMGGGFHVGKALGADTPAQAGWFAASYPLTHGTFVLVSGRLGAIYGHKYVLLLGGAWWTAWSLINAFCRDTVSFNIARGFTGMGAGLILPNAIAIIGTTFPPGRMRNFSIAFFGAAAPVGGGSGPVFAGLFTQLLSWQWLFIFLALLGSVVFVTCFLVVPKDIPVDQEGMMDWFGGALGVTCLILFNFVWNQVPVSGWCGYEIAILVISIALGISFILVEGKVKEPLLPLNIWRAPSFGAAMLVVFLSYMAYGTGFWYTAAWQQLIRKWTLLEFAAGGSPLIIFGAIAAFLSAWLIPRLAAEGILAIGALAVIAGNILVATMPAQQTYWAQVFPAVVLFSFCPDFIFTAAQIIASNSVSRENQGRAGSLIGVLQLYGTSTGVGFAGLVEVETDDHGLQPLKGYRAALYLGIGLGVIALLVDLTFVRMPKDRRGLKET